MTRTAKEVIELYNYRVWNQNDIDLAGELIGDTVIRHEVGRSIVQSHEEAVARIKEGNAKYGPFVFELPLLVVGEDGEHVSIAYQYSMPGPDGEPIYQSSMETYRVVDGRIVETWNPVSADSDATGKYHEKGKWMEDGSWL